RDSLRLEAGLCLSGTDIDAGTTPVAAALAWTIARKYRDGSAAPRFPGAPTIMTELAAGAPRLRVGLRPDGRVPLRGGVALVDTAGRSVGTVTSGSFGASAGHPVAMGYVERALAVPGTRLGVTIRARRHAVEVCALPFVPHRYYRGRGNS
ncbi:MAG: glycine cleavage T C-terminal barrel domain-containing protein, partial [Gammaproteobacteria bacterium]